MLGCSDENIVVGREVYRLLYYIGIELYELVFKFFMYNSIKKKNGFKICVTILQKVSGM